MHAYRTLPNTSPTDRKRYQGRWQAGSSGPPAATCGTHTDPVTLSRWWGGGPATTQTPCFWTPRQTFLLFGLLTKL